jgi:hypothetical protein
MSDQGKAMKLYANHISIFRTVDISSRKEMDGLRDWVNKVARGKYGAIKGPLGFKRSTSRVLIGDRIFVFNCYDMGKKVGISPQVQWQYTLEHYDAHTKKRSYVRIELYDRSMQSRVFHNLTDLVRALVSGNYIIR